MNIDKVIFSPNRRCLAICAQPPAESATEAGHMVAYHLIKALANTCQVDLVLVINDGDASEIAIAADNITILKVFLISKFDKLKNIVRRIFSVPPRFATRLSPEVIDYIQKCLDSKAYCSVYYEFSQAAALNKYIRFDGEAVASLHDLQTQVNIRSDSILDSVFCHQTFRFESSLIQSLTSVSVLSDKDASLVKNLFCYDNVSVTPPILSRFAYSAKWVKQNAEAGAILFWGAMNRVENDKAAQHFVKDVFPLIKKIIPSAKLYIVGNAPSKQLLSYVSDSIIVTGFVEDPSSYFRMASIGIVPLLSGAGIKIKTLEMLEVGLNVVSTKVGAEGIFHERLCIAEIEDFHTAVIECLELNWVH